MLTNGIAFDDRTKPAALQQAGIANIKLFGTGATNVQIGELKAGTIGDWTVEPYVVDGWMIADEVARVTVGDPTNLWDNVHLAYVVTPSNVPDVTDPDDLAIPSDYQAEFKKLWRK